MTRTFRFRSTVPAAWLEVPATTLGSGGGERPPDRHLLVSRGSVPEHRLGLHRGEEDVCAYEQAMMFGDLLAVGFAHAVHLLRWPPAGDRPRSVLLASYFVSLHHGPDAIYIASAEDVTRLDVHGRVIWTSPQIAIDGVRVESITDDDVLGEAAHNGAGEWRPFRLRAADGHPL